MKLAVIASGSSGNCAVINDGSSSILVDAGISASRILTAFKELGVDAESVKAIILTHEHTDHIKGAGPLCRKTGIPLFCTPETWTRSRHVIGKVDNIHKIVTGESIQLHDFMIVPFSIPHDAVNPIGLTLESNGWKIGIATDVGYPTKLIKQRLKNCHAILLEFNYNREMLIAGPYTWPMKQRIMSRKGHLSNDDACTLLQEIIHEDLKHLVLAHMSENNNLPELALMCVKELCNNCGLNNINFTVGSPTNRSDWLEL